MSHILSREEREALRQQAAKPRTATDALGRLIGFALGIVLLVLAVAGAAGLVAMIWRQAVR